MLPPILQHLRLPMVAAPMFIVSTPALVLAQCKAGIVGSFPALNAREKDGEPIQLDAWLKQITEELDRYNQANPDRPAAPYAVNQIVHRSNTRLERDLEICEKWKVPIWITSLGARPEVNAAAHACGGIALHDVINNTFAHKAIAKGADGLIAVAAGAGGHAGPQSPFALVGEIRNWFDGPLLLSGSIATGDAVLAAQAMGADLAYVGSPFIATTEAKAVPDYKQMIVSSGAEDIVTSSLFTGVSGNYLAPSIRAAGMDPDNLPESDTAMSFASGTSKPKAWSTIWGAGQGIGAVEDIVPAGQLIDRFATQYTAARERMFTQSAARPAAPAGMDLGITQRLRPLIAEVRAMIADRIAPLEAEYAAEVGRHPDGRFALTDRQVAIMEGLKSEARERGLWNFWLTDSARGVGLTTVEYAYLAEEMGKSTLAAEVFNCAAPDTGNMEVLERYGTAAHQERWLKPLLKGEIRSAYAMTEPDVASSDATSIALRAIKDGDDYVLNGEKWWISGAGDPRCNLLILMAQTDPDADRHRRHSMFLLDMDTPGVEVLRPMQVFGHDDAPHGHMHLRFSDVRVPAAQLVLGEGRGFEVAQGRLGPGRIHHCMRAIGQAERALDLMCERAVTRVAFGKKLADLGANHDLIADARIQIEATRLLCLKAAWMMDTAGTRAAQPWISMIKVAAPLMALKVVDEAMQIHGGAGISQDTPLAWMWTHLRTLRFADGPDAVHRRQVARAELGTHMKNET